VVPDCWQFGHDALVGLGVFVVIVLQTRPRSRTAVYPNGLLIVVGVLSYQHGIIEAIGGILHLPETIFADVVACALTL